MNKMLCKKFFFKGSIAALMITVLAGCTGCGQENITQESQQQEKIYDTFIKTPESVEQLLEKSLGALEEKKIKSIKGNIEGKINSVQYSYTLDAPYEINCENFQIVVNAQVESYDSENISYNSKDDEDDVISIESEMNKPGNSQEHTKQETEEPLDTVNYAISVLKDQKGYVATNNEHKYSIDKPEKNMYWLINLLDKVSNGCSNGNLNAISNVKELSNILKNFNCDGLGYFNNESVTVLKGQITYEQLLYLIKAYNFNTVPVPQEKCDGIDIEVYFDKDYIPVGLKVNLDSYISALDFSNMNDDKSNYVTITIDKE